MAFRYLLTGYKKYKNGTKRERFSIHSCGPTSIDAGLVLVDLIEAENPAFFEDHRRFCQPVSGGFVWWEDRDLSLEEMSEHDNVVPVFGEDGAVVDYVRSQPATPTCEVIRAFALEVLGVDSVLLVSAEDPV